MFTAKPQAQNLLVPPEALTRPCEPLPPPDPNDLIHPLEKRPQAQDEWTARVTILSEAWSLQTARVGECRAQGLALLEWYKDTRRR